MVITDNKQIVAIMYVAGIKETLDILPWARINDLVEVIKEVRENGGRVYILGNGGSSSTASHFAQGLISVGINAVSLSDNTAVVTAIANDISYANIFSEQLKKILKQEDVVICISGSGNSQNIISGIKTARQKGIYTMGIIGFNGGEVRELVNTFILVPNNIMEQVEDLHLMITHIIITSLRNGEFVE